MILPETKTGDCIVNRAVSVSKDLDISLCCKLVKVKFCSEILFRIFVGHSNFECNLHSKFECKFQAKIRMYNYTFEKKGLLDTLFVAQLLGTADILGLQGASMDKFSKISRLLRRLLTQLE